MSAATRHPFRRKSIEFSGRNRTPVTACASSNVKASSLALLSGEYTVHGCDVCCVQGAQCSDSAKVSIVSLVSHLARLGLRVLTVIPDSFVLRDQESPDTACLEDVRVFETVGELRQIVSVARPACIVLSSHDPRFDSLRRDHRTIRWAHEVPRCFDPQASRCCTPLLATNGQVMKHLPGYAGVALPFRCWDHLDAITCVYTPGPIRVIGAGNMADPRSNFKSFQVLAEKYKTMHFVWYGATRNKRWANMEFCTSDCTFTDLLAAADILLWTADNDPCPLQIFQALYLGVRVWLFEKSFIFALPALNSDIDGSSLLFLSAGAPQHAPLHTASKNPKQPMDVQRAREYVRETVSQAPESLVSAILSKTVPDVSVNEGGSDVAPCAPNCGSD